MHNHPRHTLLAPALLVGLSCLVLAPTVLYPWGRDQGMFAYAGHLVRGGAVPFRDFWDTKPPAIYYVYALAEAVFGYTMRAVRLLDLVWQCATVVALFAVARHISGRASIAWAAAILYLLSYASRGWWNTAQPDDFLNLPLALGVLVTLRARSREPSPALLFAAGALAGIALWFRYPMGAMAVACAAAVWRGSPRTSWRECAAAALGVALSAGGYALHLRAEGAWGEFVYAELVWARSYAALGGGGGPLRLGEVFRSHASVAALGLLALAGAVRACRNGRPGAPGVLIVVWAAIAAVNLSLGNKFYLYHYAPLLPPLAVAGAWAAALPFETGMRLTSRAAAAAGIACACAAAFLLVNPRYNAYCVRIYADAARVLAGRDTLERYYAGTADFPRFTSDDYSLPADMAAGRHLRERTGPEETVFIWGSETTVYALAGRRAASRFIHNFPFLCAWTPPRFGEELLSDLGRARPKYIALVANDPAWWATGTREDSLGALRRYPAFGAFIGEWYLPEGRIEDFLLFRRKEAAGEGGGHAR